MNQLSKVFKSASLSFGLIPGIAILLTSLGVPPNQSKVLWGSVVELFGALTILVLFLNKENLRSISIRKVSRICILISVLSMICLFTYIFLFQIVVVNHPRYESVFFPLFASGELKELLEVYNNYELIGEFGRDGAIEIIGRSSSSNLFLTSVVMMTIYFSCFICVTAVFGILGLRLSDND